jgi:hypothetical protein
LDYKKVLAGWGPRHALDEVRMVKKLAAVALPISYKIYAPHNETRVDLVRRIEQAGAVFMLELTSSAKDFGAKMTRKLRHTAAVGQMGISATARMRGSGSSTCCGLTLPRPNDSAHLGMLVHSATFTACQLETICAFNTWRWVLLHSTSC